MTTDLQAYELDDNCSSCPDESSNPKKALRRRKTGAFEDVIDPLAEELRDIELAPTAYGRFPIIPFFDNSDATLRVLRRMRELSPTHSSCISNIRDYVFGGELTIRRYVEPGMAFDTEKDQPLTDSERLIFKSFVKELNPELTFDQILSDCIGIYENLKTYGNGFLRIDMVTIAGKKFFYFESIDAEKCRYLATGRNEKKVLLISPEWTWIYIQRNPPEFIEVYPNWSDYGNGVMSTVIHIKNKVVGRDWYGITDSFGSLYFQYLEVQQGQHSTSGYANDFIARVFIEVTAEPDEDGDEDDFDNAVRSTFTNQAVRSGNLPKRYIIRRRLPKDEPAFIHEFQSNTDHQYHTSMSALSERQVLKSHNWHTVLLGAPTPGRLGQSDEFKNVFKQKYNSVIRQWQERSLRPMIQAFQICEMMMKGRMDVTLKYSLGLFNLYEEYLKSDSNALAKDQATDPNANQSEDGNTGQNQNLNNGFDL